MARRAFIVGAALLLAMSLASAADPAKPLATEAPAKLAFKQSETDSGVLGRVILGLTFVIAIGYGTVLLLKRYVPGVVGQSSGGARKINLLETRRLTTRATLFLVEIDGTRVLLAQSGDRIEAVHTFPAPPPSARDG